jgi:hypothetical protein
MFLLPKTASPMPFSNPTADEKREKVGSFLLIMSESSLRTRWLTHSCEHKRMSRRTARLHLRLRICMVKVVGASCRYRKFD